MGLDMFLNKKHYVRDGQRSQLRLGILEIKPERVSEIKEEIMYWRKANHIHRWFVENVQHGEDDCREYYVSRDMLLELVGILDTVIQTAKTKKAKVQVGITMQDGKATPILEDGLVITNSEDVAELLPTAEGFFFGGTDYDNYYLDECKRTRDELQKILAEPESGTFYYTSSW